MCKKPQTQTLIEQYGHSLVGTFQQVVLFHGNTVKLTEYYSMLSLLNHNALGGSEKDLDALKSNGHTGELAIYDVRIWVMVNGEIKDIISQEAIFDGTPEFIKPQAVFDTLLMSANDCEEYRINFTEGNELYKDFPKFKQFDVEISFSYKVKG